MKTHGLVLGLISLLILNSVLVGCGLNSNAQVDPANIELVNVAVDIHESPPGPYGTTDEVDLDEYKFLQYTFTIMNGSEEIGNSEMLNLFFELIPNDELSELLGEDFFLDNPVSGITGPSVMSPNEDYTITMVYGIHDSIDVNVEELTHKATLIVKLDKDTIEEFNLSDF